MRFRPADDPRNTIDDIPGVTTDKTEPGTPVEWEDNFLSNTFAWASYVLVPDWCQTPEHFTSRFTQYLFTDCPCCLFWRGLTFGYVVGGVVGAIVGMIVMWLGAQWLH
jgi:hypothetical protein